MRTRTTTATTGPRDRAARTAGPTERRGADVGQHVREAGEHRERQGVLHAARRQKDEREDRHQQGREHLSTDVRADDRLEVHHDAGEPDVVRAGDDGEEPAPEPIAVDHDVEREEEGAQPVRDGARRRAGRRRTPSRRWRSSARRA